MFAKRANNRRLRKTPRPEPARRPSRPAKPGRDWSRHRLVAVGCLLALAWGALWVRAYVVQVVEGPRLAAMALRQHQTSESMAGERGHILDRKGRTLATSVEVTSVYARPLEVEDPRRAARVLAEALGRPQREMYAKLTAKRPFVWIERQVGDRPAAVIKKAREEGLTGVHTATEFGRQYPMKHLAGQLIGFAGLDDAGLEGVELAFQDRLAGSRSKLTVQRDAAGKKLYLDAQGREAPLKGDDLSLTIDAAVQMSAEEALRRAVVRHKGKRGACLVVEVATGEVLAWAEYPFFNPNAYAEARPAQWRNRILTDAFEPGSTIKPLLVAAALQEGVVEADSLYFCENGRWRVGGVTISDTHKYEWLPVHKVVRYSSNICSAKIGVDLGPARYHAYLRELGFGAPTGLPLPGEAAGILRKPGDWQTADLAAASFGQSFSVTLVQLAQAYLALAGEGLLRPLSVIKGADAALPESRRVFDPAVARRVLAMLRDVVEEDGTGTQARIQGLSVGGKTGTAQKASPQGGYGDTYVASFVALVPAERPRYLIAAMVDEPEPSHYGGVVVAPAVREIALETLAYAGLLPDAPQGGAQPAAHAVAALDADNGPRAEAADAAKEDDHVARTHDVYDSGRMPDLAGRPLGRAVELLAARGLVPRLEGEGAYVAGQRPEPGARLPETGPEGGSGDDPGPVEVVLRLAWRPGAS